ncbi:MAG: Hpt domain-containing protein [Victivallaceae bacterium]|nr:Hpt domain-containing protein [Victivallaceae bacterium]
MKRKIMNYMGQALELEKADAEELLVMYIETLNEHCDKLKAAVAAADFAEIRRLTHSLTGCSGNVGAEEIVDAVRDVNSAAKIPSAEACSAAMIKLEDLRLKLNE